GAPGSETQDFQEFLAENETAVRHLQSAELERLQAEEDAGGPGAGLDSGLESLGVCILEEPLAVPEELCPGLAAPILIQAQLPPGSSVLCFAENSERAAASAGSSPAYLNSGPLVYYQVEPRPALGAKREPGAGEGAAAFPKEKDLSVFSLPVTSLVACSPTDPAAL
ncbi:cysteine/serine-rich nuclear protein 2-like, partial [Carlito syrichta]|uniref:Cysteine/serine-rich nuclear protein 2-like n=1 Tax=Carlito syrichta TaxID=1868482 RepID=A0A3Q0DR31_CARSF